jgi:hypothetical protein
MAGAGHDDRARKEASLLERSQELLRLCRRLDDVVFPVIDQQEARVFLSTVA